MCEGCMANEALESLRAKIDTARGDAIVLDSMLNNAERALLTREACLSLLNPWPGTPAGRERIFFTLEGGRVVHSHRLEFVADEDILKTMCAEQREVEINERRTD